jgi:AhpC/TSA family
MIRKIKIAAGWILTVACLSLMLGMPALAKRKAEPPPALKVGDMAPDFTMVYFDGHDDKQVSLHDYRGKKNVVLAFYVFAFTGG